MDLCSTPRVELSGRELWMRINTCEPAESIKPNLWGTPQQCSSQNWTTFQDNEMRRDRASFRCAAGWRKALFRLTYVTPISPTFQVLNAGLQCQLLCSQSWICWRSTWSSNKTFQDLHDNPLSKLFAAFDDFSEKKRQTGPKREEPERVVGNKCIKIRLPRAQRSRSVRTSVLFDSRQRRLTGSDMCVHVGGAISISPPYKSRILSFSLQPPPNKLSFSGLLEKVIRFPNPLVGHRRSWYNRSKNGLFGQMEKSMCFYGNSPPHKKKTERKDTRKSLRFCPSCCRWCSIFGSMLF